MSDDQDKKDDENTDPQSGDNGKAKGADTSPTDGEPDEEGSADKVSSADKEDGSDEEEPDGESAIKKKARKRAARKKKHRRKKRQKKDGEPEDSDSELEAEEPPDVTLKDAKRLLKSGQKLLKRGRDELDERQIASVEEALEELERTIQEQKEEEDEAVLAEVYHHADRVVDRHLGFARKSAFREYAESILLAVLFALLLRAFVVEAFKIPTKSMVPTLLEGDHLFVNKFAYGIRIPFTTSRLISFGDPERGDVVVFIFPREQAAEHIATHGRDCLDRASLQEEKDYIKRVVGLPGDTIEVIDNVVHINGEPVQRTVLYTREVSEHGFPRQMRNEVWSEEILDDERYVTIARQLSMAGNFGPVKVKDGHVFVMGDNRDNSSDSRCWGQVPIENIKGKAMIIWWSSGPWGPRWSRLFSLID